MTVTVDVRISGHGEQNGRTHSITLSDSSLDAVRFDFNPSKDDVVILMKGLSAALITACEQQQQRGVREVSRWGAIAITKVEEAQMFAVKAATYK